MKKFGVLPKRSRKPGHISRGGTFNPDKREEDPLTGKVQNQKAAQGEERLARTIEKGIKKGLVKTHYFRWTTLKRGTVGYKELDELVFLTNGIILAISVKGQSFVHRGTAAQEQDKINEIIILSKLRELGYKVKVVTTIPDTDLKTQDLADRAGRKLGVYR